MEDSGFSGVVRLSNVSDFIAPNLDCIIPLETKTVPEKPAENLVNIKKKTEKCKEAEEKTKKSIKISLADCLACNGCITSAETVLIEEQSIGRLWQGVESSDFSVVTVSPQSICSIAVKLGISPENAAIRISNYFLSKGVTHVIDSSFARHFTHSLLFSEFQASTSNSSSNSFLLSSACPGFVCYSEKSTNAQILVPKISRIRSPQAIAGAIVKDYLARKFQIQPHRIFHATIMPCFDKKLEASRKEFLCTSHGEEEVRETDCVISTAELYEELEKFEFSPEIPNLNQSPGFLGDLSRGKIIGENGGSSGGYAENIVRSYLKLNGGELKQQKLNKHMDSIEVLNSEGNSVLRVARVYGFRNIQNLVRKMKISSTSTKSKMYDYVEIMACPGGCSNGGGQIKYSKMDEREEQLAKIDGIYENLERRDDVLDEILRVQREWQMLNENWQKLMFTDYSIIDSNISQTLKW